MVREWSEKPCFDCSLLKEKGDSIAVTMPAPETAPHVLRFPTWRAGVSELERSDPGEGQASKYALLISDTYLIEEGQPQQLTSMATRKWSDVAYFFAVRFDSTCSSASPHMAPLLGAEAASGVQALILPVTWSL